MNHAKIFISLAISGFITMGCSGYGTKSASADDYQKALNEASITLDKANKSGFEWRDSQDILKAAEKAAQDGDFSRAVDMANQAKRQGELALQQSKKPATGPHT